MDREHVIAQIEQAFAGVRLNEGIGIFEAMAMDDYALETKMDFARQRDRKWQCWTEIPSKFIRRSAPALDYVDSDGLKFLLPAFMRYTVKYHDADDANDELGSAVWALQSGEAHYNAAFDDLFNERQHQAIALFLRFLMHVNNDGVPPIDQVSSVYDTQWSQYDVLA